MSSEKSASNTSTPSDSKNFKDQWLNPKRKRFWAVVFLLTYTLCGFLLVPLLVEKQITDTLRNDLGRESQIGEVRFNPYSFSLSIKAFQMEDTDHVELARFDEFFVNFQLSSLFRWAWTFREIRLDGFFSRQERFASGDTRLTRLLADLEAGTTTEETSTDEASGLPRMLIHALSLNDGSAHFIDHVPESPVELAMGPVSVDIQELNTLPDRYGQQSVVIRLADNSTISWQGNISLAPLESEGEFSIENSRLDQTAAYLKALLPLESVQAALSMRTSYSLQQLDSGDLDLELDSLELEVKDIAIAGLEPTTEFLTLELFAMENGVLRYPENELNFSTVRVTAPGLTAWLDESGHLSLLDLVPQVSESEAPPESSDTAASNPWQLGIDEFILDRGKIELSDNSISPAAELGMIDLQLSLSEVSNRANQEIPFRLSGGLDAGGTFGMEGKAVVLPSISANGKSSFSSIPLNLAQPYVEQFLSLLIEGGALDLESDFTVDAEQAVELKGNMSISELKTRDTAENEDLLGWQQLDIDQFELGTNERSLHLSRVEFQQLYGRLEINADQSTNLSGLLIAPAQGTEDAVEEANPWSIVIGGIAVNDGMMDFSDLSLPLPFGTRISDMDGTISTIDSSSTEPANIRVEGQVDEFGLARIEGSMRVLDPIGHTDVSLEFRNLLMSQLSPYSAQFAGREIDEGKLDLDLHYFIQQGQLQGQNDIVMSDIVLGAEVESPDAVSLPLGLAVALLKDSNGVIDIDLPVEGDINDPEFRIGGVVMKAIVGLITKVVSAPFRMLGALIGVDSEDFGQFQFLAGRSDLTPPELEKIIQLQQALNERPQLGIELSGVIDAAIDTPQLQFFRLRDTVLQRLGTEKSSEDQEIAMLDEELRSTLEAIFSERFPDESADSLKALHMAPPADDPEGKPVLDDLAYAVALRDRLLASEEISAADLDALANARAEAVRSAFLASGEFDESRIVIVAPSKVESEDGEWVPMELGVAAK